MDDLRGRTCFGYSGIGIDLRKFVSALLWDICVGDSGSVSALTRKIEEAYYVGD